MLLAPRHGFVFLAMPKAASTSIERAFRRYSQVAFQQGAPNIKHTKYAQFQNYLQPFLASKGFPRDSYEVVCAFREPVDWLSSWWRYRSREDLTNPAHRGHRNYARHVSFEEFAREYMKKGGEQFARLGRPSAFVQPLPGEAEMDRIFRYDRLDLLVDFLCEKVGKEVEVEVRNISPERSFSLSEGCEQELREFFAAEYRIYERAVGG